MRAGKIAMLVLPFLLVVVAIIFLVERQNTNAGNASSSSSQQSSAAAIDLAGVQTSPMAVVLEETVGANTVYKLMYAKQIKADLVELKSSKDPITTLMSPSAKKLAYHIDSKSEFTVVDLQTLTETKVDFKSDSFSLDSWSPDDKYLVVEEESVNGAKVVDVATGKVLTQLKTNDKYSSGIWVDNNRIAYLNGQAATTGIFRDYYLYSLELYDVSTNKVTVLLARSETSTIGRAITGPQNAQSYLAVEGNKLTYLTAKFTGVEAACNDCLKYDFSYQQMDLATKEVKEIAKPVYLAKIISPQVSQIINECPQLGCILSIRENTNFPGWYLVIADTFDYQSETDEDTAAAKKYAYIWSNNALTPLNLKGKISTVTWPERQRSIQIVSERL